MLLKSEGLYREPEAQFVYQDLTELVKELPESTSAISQGITNIGALANKYLGVGGSSMGSGKVGLADLYHMSGSNSMDREVGGNQSSGFIRAMVARDEASPEEKRRYVSSKTGQTNAEKFEGLDRRGFKLQEMTKTTHDLARKKKALTRNQAIKRFYDYVIANAPQHQPTSSVNPKRNYREAYDLDDMFDRWRETEGVEIREQRRQRREAPQEEVFPIPEPQRVLARRPQVAVPAVVEDPPHSDTVFTFLRDNGLAELKRRLRGKTAQELITFYRRQGGKTRENLRDIATAVGATHRRPPNARGPGAITSEGVAQNIVEKVAN